MLRTITFLVAIIFATNLYAQRDRTYVPDMPYDKNGQINYTEVMHIGDVSKEQFYFRAKAWFTETFRNANEVIQMDSKAAGTVIGKGNRNVYLETAFAPVEVTLHYTVKIFCKDGRYKYEITDMVYSGWVEGYRWEENVESMFTEESIYKKNGKTRWKWVQYMQLTEESCEELIESIKKRMAKEIGMSSGGDDW
ncbi:MAG: DUF4468 domain-containing protein [Flammeovirgaceae bacterium]